MWNTRNTKYKAIFSILKLDISRNIEDHQLPIDYIEIEFLSNFIEIKEKIKKYRKSNLLQDRLISKISSALLNANLEDESNKASTSSAVKWKALTDKLSESEEDEATLGAVVLVNETLTEAEEILDKNEKFQEIKVEEKADEKQIEIELIKQTESEQEINSIRLKKASQTSVKFSIDEAATSKNKIQDDYVGTEDEESVDKSIQGKKHVSIAPSKRIYTPFGSNGVIFTTKPQTLANFLERKPIRYRFYRNGEVIAYAGQLLSRAFITQILMKDFETQEQTVLVDLRKSITNVSAGKMLVKIKIVQKLKHQQPKFGRHLIAANILRW